MFYGLNKFVKNILPKRLFYRALLIVAVPVIVLQIVVTFVFFDSLWIKTNKGMTKAVVNEISTFIEVYNDEIYNKNEITNLFSIYQDLNIEFIQDKCDLLNSYQVGQDVKIGINLRGREWVNPEGETKYFNSIQGWRIETLQIETSSEMPPVPPNSTFEAADDDKKEVEDDLPF